MFEDNALNLPSHFTTLREKIGGVKIPAVVTMRGDVRTQEASQPIVIVIVSILCQFRCC